MEMTEPIRIGISSCLLGNEVRWDGSHRRDRYLLETLGKYVDYVPVCPEVECGMSVPRETLRLVGDPENPRLITTKTKVDRTEMMQTWAREKLAFLSKQDLCGFIFKKGSPSSGMTRVKVYHPKGHPVGTGSGLFARAFMDRLPLIPVEEEGRLHDPKLRETFIEQIFTLKRWRDLLACKRTIGALVKFHTHHKLLLLSHSQKHYRLMGKLVAEAKQRTVKSLFDQYEALLIETLRLKTTPKKQINVLLHMLGYFKKQLSADEKQEMLETIEHYRADRVPLIVPLTLFNHYVRKYEEPYLKGQYYLNPHPLDLKLRNHV